MHQPDTLERLRDARKRRASASRGDDGEVLGTGEVSVKAWLVDDRADARERFRAARGHRDAPQGHRPAVRTREAEQHPDERRLPRAVWPEIAEGDAARNLQVDIANHGSVAEALRQPMRLDDVLGLRHAAEPT